MELIVICAGGFGREVAWVARRAGFAVAGFCDDAPGHGADPRNGAPFLGTIEEAAAAHPAAGFVVANGSNPVRRELTARAVAAGWEPRTVADPTAVVAPDAAIGPGCILGAGSVVSCGAVLGAGVIVNHQATVGHDARVADFGQLCPGARLSGGCTMEAGATLGSNAAVVPLKRVGEGAVVAAGAAAFSDVPAGQTVVRLSHRERAP